MVFFLTDLWGRYAAGIYGSYAEAWNARRRMGKELEYIIDFKEESYHE